MGTDDFNEESGNSGFSDEVKSAVKQEIEREVAKEIAKDVAAEASAGASSGGVAAVLPYILIAVLILIVILAFFSTYDNFSSEIEAGIARLLGDSYATMSREEVNALIQEDIQDAGDLAYWVDNGYMDLTTAFGVLDRADVLSILNYVSDYDAARWQYVDIHHDHCFWEVSELSTTTNNYSYDFESHGVGMIRLGSGDDVYSELFSGSTYEGYCFSVNADGSCSAFMGHTVHRSYVETETNENGLNRFSLRWQPVFVLCVMKAMQDTGQWGASEEIRSDVLAGAENGYDDYFLDDWDIDACCDVFAYRFSYYYDVVTAAVEDGVYDYYYDDMGAYSWVYYDILEDCDAGALELWYPGYTYSVGDRTLLSNNILSEPAYYRTCRVPASAPNIIKNSYETISYRVDTAEYLFNSLDEEAGGVIVGRTVYSTPHAFVDACEAATDGAFDFSMFIAMLDALPGTDDLVPQYRQLYEEWLSTESDLDESLAGELETSGFSALGTVIGEHNPALTGEDVNHIPEMAEEYFYIDTIYSNDMLVNGYLRFTPECFAPLDEPLTDDISYSWIDRAEIDDWLLQVNERWNGNGAFALRDCGDAFEWFNDEYDTDMTAMLAIMVAEGVFCASSQPGNIAYTGCHYNYNFFNFMAASGDEEYYTYLNLLDDERPAVHWDDIRSFFEDNATPEKIEDLIAQYNQETGDSATSLSAVPISYIKDVCIASGYLRVLGNSHGHPLDVYQYVMTERMEDMLFHCGVDSIYELTETDIKNYCLYYCMCDIDRRYVHRGENFERAENQDTYFAMCYQGCIVDEWGFPEYQTREEVLEYTETQGRSPYHLVSHAYCRLSIDRSGYSDEQDITVENHWVINCATYREQIYAILITCCEAQDYDPL